MNFAQTLNYLIDQCGGPTSYRMGKDTGISNRLIDYWRKGEKMPGAENLKKLADYFGVTTDYLLNGGLSSVTQTHLASGVHIYKSAVPFDFDNYALPDISKGKCKVVYQSPNVLITMDKNSTLTQAQVEEIVQIYSSHSSEKKPTPVSESGLNEKTTALLDLLETLTPENQAKLIEIAHLYSEDQKRRKEDS